MHYFLRFRSVISFFLFSGVILFSTSCNKGKLQSDKVYSQVDNEAQFKGGQKAWLQFLLVNCKYPQEAIDNEVTGTVPIQFVVETDGSVSGIKALDGPEILQKEAVRIIQLSNHWEPATVGGKAVRSYKTQPVIFKLEAQ